MKEAFLVMGCAYFAFMMFGAFTFRVPAPGWQPEGYVPPATPKRLVTHADVSVDRAWKTPQFWLLWAVLCLNVTAGIGILGQASLMCQDMFGVSAAVGGGFAGLLSLFNMAGRLFWSVDFRPDGTQGHLLRLLPLRGCPLCSRSRWPRSITACRFFVVCHSAHHLDVRRGIRNDPRLPPRPLRHHASGRDSRPPDHRVVDGRGPRARSWSTTSRPTGSSTALPRAEAYNVTMYLMAGLLLVGLVCNLLVRPVDERFHHREADPLSVAIRSRSDLPHRPERNIDHGSLREEVLAALDRCFLD